MNDYFNNVIAFDNLYKGMKKSCRNVRWKDSVVGYESNGLKNTASLRNDLLNGTYKISPYQVFKIYEPKERVIVATRIRDRQFQRSLCGNGLYQDITEHFIRDNVACQIGKGTDDAFKRMKTHLHRFYRKHGTDGWVLKCDIHHFFPETRHDVAKDKIRKVVSDERAYETVCKIIDSFDGEKGIGLGSQVSQLVELAVLNDLDHFIKEKLRIKYYIRYMDDFVLIHEDKEYLKECKRRIEIELAKIGLELNKKSTLFPLKQGIKFLQWRFVLTDTGKVLMLINRKKVSKQKKRITKMLIMESKDELPHGTAKISMNSWLANAKRGNSIKAQNEVINHFANEQKRWFKNDI